MPKKKSVTKASKTEDETKAPIKEPKEKQDNKDKIISILVDNSIVMQKAFTNLSEKMNKLTTQIAELIKLFEVTARSIAERPELGFEKEFTDRLNTLIEQNRIIARGMSLMSQQPMPQPAPRAAMAAPRPSAKAGAAPKPTAPTETTKMPGPTEEFSASEYETTASQAKPETEEAETSEQNQGAKKPKPVTSK